MQAMTMATSPDSLFMGMASRLPEGGAHAAVSTLDRAARDTLDIESLHRDEEGHDRDRHEYRPCSEHGEIGCDVLTVDHAEQPEGDCVVLVGRRAHDHVHEDEVSPRSKERDEDRID